MKKQIGTSHEELLRMLWKKHWWHPGWLFWNLYYWFCYNVLHWYDA